ncbi:MAG TPA: hypothetical protein VFW33_15300 [Gemmataceae bacterium]|nr:hypothetical protein [Gemmataceae bacterium]
MTTEEQARAIKRRHSAELLQQPGVCGVGVEKDESGGYVLAVHLESADPAVPSRLPAQIEGLPVRLIPSGPFRKFGK